ncbi:trimethylamine methyltransferase family protein [Desulfobacterales bacterium HSG2]|nr:trimethylamine methyltransferase family protein [Desulfobacterales bacterium HSG2]
MSEKAKELFVSGAQLERDFDFESAKKVYEQVISDFPETDHAGKAQGRLADMDSLIEEKKIYERIDKSAKDVLSKIGINVSESPEIMEILMEADAVDFDNEEAVFVPLKPDYVERCLELVPRTFAGDPGRNCFGTGATPPFLKREGDDELRGASRDEFEKIVRVVGEKSDVVDIFSVPVQTDKSMSDYECARAMEDGFSGLKMISTKKMTDEEVLFLKGKNDWVDGTSLMTSMTYMNTMVSPFIRSAGSGNNLLLLDLTIAGASGPNTPESLLTLIHAQVLSMMVLAQTVNPGVTCLHGGIPGVTESGGDLSYSSPSQPLINAAMARLNLWVSKFPSAQSGGSSSAWEDLYTAIAESDLSRNTLRKYGVHIVRHALGALGSLNFFSLLKFKEDCDRENIARKVFEESQTRETGVIPLYFPADDTSFEGIKEMAEKGNPKNTDHSLRNVEAFMKWEKTVNEAAKKKLYFPQLNDTVIEIISQGEMTP